MTVPEEAKLSVPQNNDAIVIFQLFKDPNVAYDLTGMGVELIVKTSRATADTDKLFSYSSTDPSPRITVTNAQGGEITCEFNANDLQNPGTYFWRLDLRPAGNKRRTIRYGPFEIIDV